PAVATLPLRDALPISLREAAALEEAAGSVTVAARYRALAAEITAAAHRTAWSEERGLLADTPAKALFSQHANILAVLADVVPPRSEEHTSEFQSRANL